MLSRKHYIMIAKVIKGNSIYSNNSTRRILKKDALIKELCVELKRDNINFNVNTFVDACD